MALRLSAQGWQVSQSARYLDWIEQTVRQTMRRWETRGLGGLWEAPGRGRPRRWSEEDWQALEQWAQEPRRYSARQLQHKLEVERQVHLGSEQVRRILKKDLRVEAQPLCPSHQCQPRVSRRYTISLGVAQSGSSTSTVLCEVRR